MILVGMVALNPQSDIPLYRQLFNHFTQSIENGSLGEGERLPATRELAGQLGLNRTTVSAAYELLEAEGWISGEVGRGSFVRRKTARKGLNWRELLTSVDRPQPAKGPGASISFATSRPSELLFPLEAFRESCEEVLRSAELPGILQLGSPGGYEPLRQYLLEAARSEGTADTGDDVMVTNGCQQALDLIRSVLLRSGDRVAIEDPVYPGVKNLFPDASGIPVGQMDAIERLKPKLLVLTPNFQNPTGETLPLQARKDALRAVTGVLVENDIYGDLRYEGDALPTLKQLDETGDTILIRSFSKVAFPGLRVGWVIAPKPVIAKLVEAKQLTDLHTDQFSQAVLLRFAQSGRLAAHQRSMLRSGAERLRAVLHACEEWLPAGTSFSRPQGGMNLWVQLPEPLDASDLLPRAQEQGVTYLPGRYFAVTRRHGNGLRLSFAGLSPDRIERGVRILGEVFGSALETERLLDREPVSAMV